MSESNVLENQRKATDYEYDSGDDKSKKRVAKVEESQLATAASVVVPRLLRRSQRPDLSGGLPKQAGRGSGDEGTGILAAADSGV